MSVSLLAKLQSALDRVIAFVRLGRPHFLAGGFLLHGLGAAMALFSGATFDAQAYLWGQLAVTATQWMTHYANDYFDLEADRANLTPTHWSGGSRVLPEGKLPPRVALLAALALAAVALLATGVVAWAVRPGPLAAPMLLTALLLSWSYSAPPLRLHSSGIGEFVVALLVPGLTPLVGFYFQAGRVSPLPLLAVLPLVCLQFAMVLSIEFPDAAGDAAAGKKTLAVRIGAARLARLYVAALVSAYASLPLLVWAGLPPLAALATTITMPLAVWQVWRMTRRAWANPAHWGSLSFWTVGLLMMTTSVQLAAFAYLALGVPSWLHG